MADPNNVFIRERTVAGGKAISLSPTIPAFYAGLGQPSGTPASAYVPFIAKGSTVSATGTQETIPGDVQTNPVCRTERTTTQHFIALSKQRTMTVFPLLGGKDVALGLVSGLAEPLQDANVTGVFDMSVEQAFIDAASMTFVATRDVEGSVFSLAQRGALEYFIELPAIEGSGSDDVISRVYLVRDDSTVITAEFRYIAETFQTTFTLLDGESQIVSSPVQRSSKLVIIADPSAEQIEFIVNGTSMGSVAFLGSPTFEFVVTFEQRLNTYSLNPNAVFKSKLVTDHRYFSDDYFAESFQLIEA